MALTCSKDELKQEFAINRSTGVLFHVAGQKLCFCGGAGLCTTLATADTSYLETSRHAMVAFKSDSITADGSDIVFSANAEVEIGNKGTNEADEKNTNIWGEQYLPENNFRKQGGATNEPFLFIVQGVHVVPTYACQRGGTGTDDTDPLMFSQWLNLAENYYEQALFRACLNNVFVFIRFGETGTEYRLAKANVLQGYGGVGEERNVASGQRSFGLFYPMPCAMAIGWRDAETQMYCKLKWGRACTIQNNPNAPVEAIGVNQANDGQVFLVLTVFFSGYLIYAKDGDYCDALSDDASKNAAQQYGMKQQ